MLYTIWLGCTLSFLIPNIYDWIGSMIILEMLVRKNNYTSIICFLNLFKKLKLTKL